MCEKDGKTGMIQPHLDRVLPLVAKGAQSTRDLANQLTWDSESIRILAKLDPRFHVFGRGNAWYVELATCAADSLDTLTIPTPATPTRTSTMELTVNLNDSADCEKALALLTLHTGAKASKTKPTGGAEGAKPMEPTSGAATSVQGTPATATRVGSPTPATATSPTTAAAPAATVPVGTTPAIGIEDCRNTYKQLVDLVGAEKAKPLAAEALRAHGATTISNLPAQNILSFLNHLRRDIKANTPAPVGVAAAEVDPMG